MFNTRQNYHHSKLPKLGDIFRIPIKGIQFNNDGSLVCTSWMVIAYPLCDNVLPYSIGIHTCYIQSLADSTIKRISGHYLINQD